MESKVLINNVLLKTSSIDAKKTITINKVDIKLCETDGSGAVSYLRLSNL